MSEYIIGAIVAVLMIFACFAYGCIVTHEFHQDDLIKRGIAEWQIDAKTGEKRFVYILGFEPEKE